MHILCIKLIEKALLKSRQINWDFFYKFLLLVVRLAESKLASFKPSARFDEKRNFKKYIWN